MRIQFFPPSKVNGVDIRHVHASTAMAYGRILLDILFTRQDLQGSVIFPTPRSNRPALDSKKVDLLISKLL